MTTKKRLLKELDNLEFRKMWETDAENGRKFSVFLRNHSSEVGAPFGMVLIMDYPKNNGFEIFTTVADTNNLEDDLMLLKEKFKGDKLKLFKVSYPNDDSIDSKLVKIEWFEDWNLSINQVNQINSLVIGKTFTVPSKKQSSTANMEIKRIH